MTTKKKYLAIYDLGTNFHFGGRNCRCSGLIILSQTEISKNNYKTKLMFARFISIDTHAGRLATDVSF
jgi:hypothetical protein